MRVPISGANSICSLEEAQLRSLLGTAELVFSKRSPDNSQQFLLVDRLGEEADSARFEGAGSIFISVATGDYDDRHVLGFLHPSQPFQAL